MTAPIAVKGSCHCGATQFTVAKRPDAVTRCTCSFCSKRGALWAYCETESDFTLTKRDHVSTYQWGSNTIEHHHCAICGCSTWSRSPVWDLATRTAVAGKFKIGVNAWLLDGFDMAAQPVQVIDGRNLW